MKDVAATPHVPLDQVCVALDLETTGLASEQEKIIEVGAVKFRGEAVLDTFQTLVNPLRTIPAFIGELTGITQAQVDAAPSFSTIEGELAGFLGDHPIVGHSIGFDLAFLQEAGLTLANPRYDTMELASVLLPSARGYALTALAETLGIDVDRPHRALEDARMAHELFLRLVAHATTLTPEQLTVIRSMAERSSWPMSHLFQLLENATPFQAPAVSSQGMLGISLPGVRERLARPPAVDMRGDREEIDPSEVEDLLGDNGLLARTFPQYEFRPQQLAMATAVAEAFNNGEHLIVEAGTGVGKSIAYLVPAILFAMRNGQRVVISTNTINLQEQLIDKDVPHLQEALLSEPGTRRLLRGFNYTRLKGRANYLCFRRWAQMVQSAALSADDARMASKALVWLQDTAVGDRAELNIPGRDNHLWGRISASDAGGCMGRDGVCFLRAARGRAEASHIVVVNHSLLLGDVASGAGVIPEYDYLIIDEAHHLENEASRQFGYEVSTRTVEEVVARLGQQLQGVRGVVRNTATAVRRSQQLEGIAAEAEPALRRLRESWEALAAGLVGFAQEHRTDEGGSQLRMTRSTRNQPAWYRVEVLWGRFDELLKEAQRLASRLLLALDPVESSPLREITLELESWGETSETAGANIRDFVAEPDVSNVYWITLAGQDAQPVLNAAPLDVSTTLQEELFDQKEAVVLTSATLSVDGSTEYIRQRTGFPETTEVLLGSPFDYKKSALLVTCPEVPDPRDPMYSAAIQDALVRIARASGGGMLALFTSHNALRAVRRAIRPLLDADGIPVLAQGVDGTPRQIMEFAQDSGNAVLLGTASLWEGVDLPGDSLRVVVLARLPFNVPTEPVFAARSETFDDPFSQYTVPQAVLRFRQGFGRLIRSRDDRGVVVVLDSRIQSKRYGGVFLRSIPECTAITTGLRDLGPEVAAWLGQ